MKRTKNIQSALALLLAAALCAPSLVRGMPALAAAPQQAQPDAPPAQIENDAGGPVRVTGAWAYTSYAVATHVLEPVVMLIDVTEQIQGDPGAWVPRIGQVLGTLTSPMSPAPVQYQIAVPMQPIGRSIDVDNDAAQDAGVQVLAVLFGANLVGDSYLEQMEQGGISSVLLDPQTDDLRSGTLLVYAPDDAQGFPSGAGADGLYFTADDPIMTLPAGYTLATLGTDGAITFDRSVDARMDVLEAVADASPDLSDRGILDSFNALIDLLAVRYAYTALHEVDWEHTRATYLPAVEAADAVGDFTAYYLALNDLALSVQDAHVQVTATDPAVRLAPALRYLEGYGAGLGAGLAALDDGRFIVNYVDPEGPAAKAGWGFGTEIVAVDGLPIEERVATSPFLEPESTDEGVRLARLPAALAFPAGVTTTIAYRNPGATDLLTTTLTAAEGLATAPETSAEAADIGFKALEGGLGYIHWSAFDDPLYKIAVWEKFLQTYNAAPGIVIDLRGNGGGNLGLMYTMASYLFGADAPAQTHWLDNDVYDETAGTLVRARAVDSFIYSPKPELTYNGAVVVLVDEGLASAAEYMPQFLQGQGRALVVGEHGTDGAGGVIERARLPGGITFQFTKGRTLFAGSDEPNLEGKGVQLDLDLPTSDKGEQARLEGRDLVLEAAIDLAGQEATRREAARLAAQPWQWTGLVDMSAATQPVNDPGAYTLAFARDGTLAVTADCNTLTGAYTLADGGLTLELGEAAVDACGAASRAGEFVTLLAAVVGVEWSNGVPMLDLDDASGALGLQLAPGE